MSLPPHAWLSDPPTRRRCAIGASIPRPPSGGNRLDTQTEPRFRGTSRRVSSMFPRHVWAARPNEGSATRTPKTRAERATGVAHILGDIMERAPKAMLATAMAFVLAATASGCGLSLFFPVVEESTPIPEDVDASLEPYLLAGPPLGPVRRVPLHHGEGAPRLGRPVGGGDRARAHPPAREGGQGRLAPREPRGTGRFGVQRRGRVRGRRRDRGRPGPLRHRRLRSAGRRVVRPPSNAWSRRSSTACSTGSRRARAGATRGSPGRTSSRTPWGRRAWRTPARCSPTSTP